MLILVLFILFQDGNEVFFRIKRSTQLKKLMNAYCDRQSVELNSIAFLFDGRRLRAEQTPDEVSLSLSLTYVWVCACSFAQARVFLQLFDPLVSHFTYLLLQLEMEDGDEIDAMLHQTGGAVA